MLRGEVPRTGGLFRTPSAFAGWFQVPVARAPGSESAAKSLTMYSVSKGDAIVAVIVKMGVYFV